MFVVHDADPDRPRNDKATIITETIQVLKDITSEVDRLKTEHKSLSEESREVRFLLFIQFVLKIKLVCSFIYSFDFIFTANTRKE